MRRAWRWRVCVLGWVVAGYLVIMAAVSLLYMADNARIRSQAGRAANGMSFHGVWAWNSHPGGGRGARLPWCKELRFVDPPGVNTALASFPGSGNTWLRYLLQQVAGFYTGSVYKDFALMKNGFPAENVSNGSVIIVKTHEYGAEVRQSFSRAILIIRDPYQSIQAEFNRQSAGHIGHAQPDKYSKDNGRFWTMFVQNKVLSWINTNLDWLRFGGPLHVLFYEDLLDNLPEEMRRIIEFLDLDVDDDSFYCMMKHRDGIYKRRRRNLTFDPYSQSMKNLINYCKKIVDDAVKEFLAGTDMDAYVTALNITRISPVTKEPQPKETEIKLAR